MPGDNDPVTRAELLAAVEGRCPYCSMPVRDYKAPTGSFAPEMWETLRERGIDPSTGHRNNCQRSQHVR